jgi:DNA-binding response OmpR family regulator
MEPTTDEGASKMDPTATADPLERALVEIPPFTADPFNALIVEDDTVTARLLELTLTRRCGALARVVSSAEEAAPLLRLPIAWDIVFVDIGLPHASGLDLLQHSRRLRPEVPHVVVTGRCDDADVAAANAAGASDYLVKPVATKALIAAVDDALGRTAGTDGSVAPEGSTG